MPFGLSQRNKPTPAKVNIIFGVIGSMIAFLISWSATNDIMNPKLENALTAIGGLIIGLMPIIKPLWGVDVESKTVPSDKVTAIDTDT